MSQEIHSEKLVHDFPSQAEWDAEHESPFFEFHYNGVYDALRRMRTTHKRFFLFPYTQPDFKPSEAELIRLMARDSEVFQNRFKQDQAVQLDPKSVARATGRGIAATINEYLQSPDKAIIPEVIQAINLEAALIGLMVSNPRRVFTLLEQQADKEIETNRQVEAGAQSDLVDASIGPWMVELATREANDLKRSVMSRLLRPHLMQLDLVTQAAQTQEILRRAIRTRGSDNQVAIRMLPYPHIPDGSMYDIVYSLGKWGFEHVRGYQWTEVVEVQTPTRRVRRPRSSAS